MLIAASLLAVSACSGDGNEVSTATATPTPILNTATITPTETLAPSPTICPSVPAVSPVQIVPLDDVAAARITDLIRFEWSPEAAELAGVPPSGPEGCLGQVELRVVQAANGSSKTVATISRLFGWSPSDAELLATVTTVENPETTELMAIKLSGESRLVFSGDVSQAVWGTDYIFAVPTQDSPSPSPMFIDGDGVSRSFGLDNVDVVTEAAWSSEGEVLAVAGYSETSNGERTYSLFAIAPDNPVPKLVMELDGTIDGLTWSAQGTLAFTGHTDSPTIYTASDPLHGTPEPLASDAASASWSPDGQRVAYVSDWCNGFGVVVRELATASETELVAPGESATTEVVWSNKGDGIAFDRIGADGGTYVVNSDGSGLARIADRMVRLQWSFDDAYLAGLSNPGGRGLCS